MYTLKHLIGERDEIGNVNLKGRNNKGPKTTIVGNVTGPLTKNICKMP